MPGKQHKRVFTPQAMHDFKEVREREKQLIKILQNTEDIEMADAAEKMLKKYRKLGKTIKGAVKGGFRFDV